MTSRRLIAHNNSYFLFHRLANSKMPVGSPHKSCDTPMAIRENLLNELMRIERRQLLSQPRRNLSSRRPPRPIRPTQTLRPWTMNTLKIMHTRSTRARQLIFLRSLGRRRRHGSLLLLRWGRRIVWIRSTLTEKTEVFHGRGNGLRFLSLTLTRTHFGSARKEMGAHCGLISDADI